MDNKLYKEILIKRTYTFSLSIVLLAKNFSSNGLSSQIIFKQLIRSATSIGANIVEAQASSSRKDFSNFINHALKSSNETRYWLALLRDSEASLRAKTNTSLKEAQEISQILGSTVKKLRAK